MSNHTVLGAVVASLLFFNAAKVAAQDVLDLRIEVDRAGLHEISGRSIAEFVSGRDLIADRLTLLCDGKEVPIEVRGADELRFGPRSSIVFFGEPATRKPGSHGVYRLVYGRAARRIRTQAAALDKPREDALVHRRFEEDDIFEPGASVRASRVDPLAADGWHYWRAIAPPQVGAAGDAFTAFALDLRSPLPLPLAGANARLVVRLRSHLGGQEEQTIILRMSGRELTRASWSEPGLREVTIDVPVEVLAPITSLSIENASTVPTWTDAGNEVRPQHGNVIFVDSIDMTWPAALTGPTSASPQIVYDFALGSDVLDVVFQPLTRDAFRTYEVATATFRPAGRASVRDGGDSRVVVTTESGYFNPVEIGPWSRRALSSETGGADWVAIVPSEFQRALEPLVRHRAAQGLTTMVVDPREIYDSFAHGRTEVDAVRRFLERARDHWATKPSYVVLVGDADRDEPARSNASVVPTALVPTLYNGATASDRALVPEGLNASIGRLPFRRTTELSLFVDRLLRYESKPASGAWRRRLAMVAGEGRFGPVVDGLIERFAMSVLTRDVPAGFDVLVSETRAGSAHRWPAATFSNHVVSSINEGCLIFAYAGHGHAQGFDRIRDDSGLHPILSSTEVGDVDAGRKPCLMAVLACSTAAFADPLEDCIDELLLRRSGGPIAVIGGTAITHPLPNALLGRSLVQEFFAADDVRIGPLFDRARARVVRAGTADPLLKLVGNFLGQVDRDRLFADHDHLYVLLGDPATCLARPRAVAELDAPEGCVAGDEVSVKIQVPAEKRFERGLLTIELPRDQRKPVTDVASESSEDPIVAAHRRANDKVLAQTEFDGDAASAMTIKITVPADVEAGLYLLKVFAEGEDGAWVGARELRIGGR